MKHFAALLLALPIFAQASCKDGIEETFDTYKVAAQKLFPKATKLNGVGIAFKKDIAGRNAQYSSGSNLVEINLEICSLAKEQQESIVAHELGHVIAMQHGHTSELHADHYGASIMSRSTFNSLLEILDTACDSDNVKNGYECRRATAWRVAAFNAL